MFLLSVFGKVLDIMLKGHVKLSMITASNGEVGARDFEFVWRIKCCTRSEEEGRYEP